ncbi:carboxylesterase family protein [Streptomyces sp. S1D4-11]
MEPPLPRPPCRRHPHGPRSPPHRRPRRQRTRRPTRAAHRRRCPARHHPRRYRPAPRRPLRRPHHPLRSGPLPVVVWLHGGGFTGGSGNDFDPTELVTENNVVVVTVDYRLGALGFLAAPALAPRSPAGNYGLRDQQAALRRVKANIAHWDGDTRVTLGLSQSAGGGSVCAQLRDTGVLSA